MLHFLEVHEHRQPELGGERVDALELGSVGFHVGLQLTEADRTVLAACARRVTAASSFTSVDAAQATRAGYFA